MSDVQHSQFAGPGIMLISAAIFGYFGFATSFSYTGVNGQFLFFVALLDWTLKVSAVVFLVSGLLSFVAPLLANGMYAVTGLLGAIAFLVVAVLDIMDTQHTVMHPFILIAFALWNGFGSWQGVRALKGAKSSGRSAAPHEMA